MSKDTSGRNAPNPPVSGTPPMTLRQWYAGLAMQSLSMHEEYPPQRAAKFAFEYADAMIAEGSK